MRTVFGFLAFFVSSALLSQQVEIPVTNWTVPPYNEPAAGITTMTDFTPPRVFVAVTPCRVVDTRNPVGPYGGPALVTNIARPFDIDNGPCPGIPVGVDAYSLNFGGILPPADGFLTAWPTGISQPVVSQLNLVGGEVVANAAIVPAGTNGAINVLVNIGPTHVYIDINGYFSDTLGNPGNFLQLVNNSDFYTFFGRNQSPSCLGACGVYMQTDSTAGNVAILGAAVGATGQNVGVEGFSASTTAGSVGVHGISPATTGKRYGVLGEIDGSINAISDTAGVLGRDTLGPVAQNYETLPAGVRGESTFSFGVLGISAGGVGVDGIANNIETGIYRSEGRLGAGDYGVYAFGDFGGTGDKYFVDPHPTDASKVIRYIALEGNEPGTYFRGRGRFRNGLATIDVPEDFRMVTDEEGLTVQVTPIGGMASVGVLRIGLDRIIVQSSRDLDFSYTVNGIRSTHKGAMNPIAENEFEYVPRSADERMPAYLTEGQKKLLIQNGTYNADGTVNMETARRLGWDRKWAERGRPTPAPVLD